jgi:DNA-binding beta-propeller fold protein YncE
MPQSGPGANARPSCHEPEVPAPTRDDQSHGQAERTPVRFYTPRRSLSSATFSMSPRRSCIRLHGSQSAARIRLLLSFAGVLAILMFSSASALAANRYPSAPSSTFGSAGSGAGQFESPNGVAVNDATGDVYVVDGGNARVEWFDATGGKLEGQFDGSGSFEVAGKTQSGTPAPTGKFSGPHSIAVDDSGRSVAEDPSVGDVYVVDTGHNVVDKFNAQGEYQGQLTGSCETGPCTGEEAFEEVGDVAVSRSGDVWVSAHFYPAVFYEFSPTGRFLRSFSAPTLGESGFALDSREDIFSPFFNHVSEVNPASPDELLAEFDEAPTGVAVNPVSDEVLVDKGPNIDLFEPFPESGEQPVQTFPSSGLSESSALAVGANGVVYATESAGEVAVFQPVTIPTVHTSPATNSGEGSVVLHGTLDPAGVPITACTFEYAIYGTEAGVYTQRVPCAQSPAAIGSGSAPVSVSTELTGLQPGSSYNVRLVAANANGESNAKNVLFAVPAPFTSTALGLPDGRAYELVSTIENTPVSPPENGEELSYEEAQGELVGIRGAYRAAADGEAVTYAGGSPGDGSAGAGVQHNGAGTHYLAARGAHGWLAAADQPAPTHVEMTGFSEDLSLQIFNRIFNEAEHETSFDAEFGAPGNCGAKGTVLDARTGPPGDPSYRALFGETLNPGECDSSEPAGVSADDRHVLFQSAGAYTAQAVPGRERISENLYDAVDGGLHLVSILPSGHPTSSATFGGLTGFARGQAEFSAAYNFGHDVSADGSRIVWTDVNSGVIYDRENDAAGAERCTGAPQSSEFSCTVQVSAGRATYRDATPDGRYVFYTEAGELWRFDTNAQTREVIAGEGLAHEAADVGGMIGASEDGSYVYFVAGAVLASNANPEGSKAAAQTCEPSEEGHGGTPCNLYVDHAGATTYIATLSALDDEVVGTSSLKLGGTEANAGDWRLDPGFRSAEVAPDGQGVAFMSAQPLTGYDNRGILRFVNGQPPELEPVPEMFVYRPATNRLDCVSCDPSGQPPVPTQEQWENSRGGFAPISTSVTFMPRWVNATGTEVFFETSQPLVARDTNDRLDVYEWRSEGTSGCAHAGGCVSLISGGDETDDAFFVDASVGGEDVFFTSRESLAPSAVGDTAKVYDARVDGGFPEATLACTGTGCQGAPPSAALFATPPSLTFSGAGNFAPVPSTPTAKGKKRSACRKGFVKNKRGKCVAKHKRKAAKHTRKAAKSSQRPGHDWRA